MYRIFITTGLAIWLASCSSTPNETSMTNIRIDTETTYQTIRHFGASAAWWAQLVGTWDEATVNEIMDLLYDDHRGIGLNLIRYNLGGGRKAAITRDALRSAETLEVEPGNYDWERDAAAVSIIDAAVDRGAQVVLFANSPPERLTVTGSTTGNGSSTNLIAGGDEAFATYLVDAAEYLRNRREWPITDISPINEPQWEWGSKNGQEGSHWSPDEAAGMIAALSAEIRERNLDCGISAIESAEMSAAKNASYLEALDRRGLLGNPLGHYAVHSYRSSGIDKRKLREFLDKRYPGTELWMTEWTEMKSGRDTGMDSALNLAATVHEDFTFANVSSWQYWIALSPYNYRDGLLYIDPATREFTVTKRLWALGHWSRFIRPGALRVASDITSGQSILQSAYRNPDGSTICVLVNMNRNRLRIVNLSMAVKSFDDMRVFITDQDRNLEKIEGVIGGSVNLPPAAIVTVVLNSQ